MEDEDSDLKGPLNDGCNYKNGTNDNNSSSSYVILNQFNQVGQPNPQILQLVQEQVLEAWSKYYLVLGIRKDTSVKWSQCDIRRTANDV